MTERHRVTAQYLNGLAVAALATAAAAYLAGHASALNLGALSGSQRMPARSSAVGRQKTIVFSDNKLQIGPTRLPVRRERSNL